MTQIFLHFGSFPHFQFLELRILSAGSNNCLGHTYFYRIVFPLQFPSIFLYSLLIFSEISLCIFSNFNIKLKSISFAICVGILSNFAQIFWSIQMLLRSTSSIPNPNVIKVRIGEKNLSVLTWYPIANFESNALISVEREFLNIWKFWRHKGEVSPIHTPWRIDW